MAKNSNWKELEQKTYRDAQQDGLADFLIGSGMFCVAGLVLTLPFLKTLFYLPILLFSCVGEVLRGRFTYPRTGYVKFELEKPKKVVGGIMLIIIGLMAIMALAFTLFRDVRNFDLWLKWFPSFCGTLLVGLFLDLTGKSGSGRYHVYYPTLSHQ
ncbi:MAG: hypothetical protein ACE5R6_02445 [Candidatus Heimdallarchaeota archaeon]